MPSQSSRHQDVPSGPDWEGAFAYATGFATLAHCQAQSICESRIAPSLWEGTGWVLLV